jgi:hypothetical protein
MSNSIHDHLLIVDFHTGKFYQTPAEAAKIIGIDPNVLLNMLLGKERNRTPFKLA